MNQIQLEKPIEDTLTKITKSLKNALIIHHRKPSDVRRKADMTRQYWHYLLSGKHNFELATIVRLAEAADFDMEIIFKPKK